MNPSLALFFAEMMQQYRRLYERPRPCLKSEIVRMVRLDMATLVGTLCVKDDKITDNESIRQEILDVAAGCFKMLDIIGDHPVDRLARELDVSRVYAEELYRVVAYNRLGTPAAFIDCCGDMEMEKRMEKSIAQAFKKEIKTPDQK